MDQEKKKVALFGSTGSVGKQALEVIRSNLDRLQIVALTAQSNVDLIEQQALEFKPEIIALYEEKSAKELKRRHPEWKIVSGMEGLVEVATLPSANFVLMSMGGTKGILPTLEAIKAKKTIGLANKEVLVSAGEIIMSALKREGVSLLPVDSEHSAIFQCLQGSKIEEVKRLILTASGGPFLHHTLEELKHVTYQEALKHPTWQMGMKVSINCSNLMNKGFEVIEARWLFDIPIEKIDVIIHPQSIVQSFVEFIDGAVLAQMSFPTMELPIQYALCYPHRVKRDKNSFHFGFGKLEFIPPDKSRFKCLDLAYHALKVGGTLPCVLNAANEVLVDRFCRGEVSWLHLQDKLETVVLRHKATESLSLDLLMEVDREARYEAMRL